MIELSEHAQFIVWAYIGSALVVAALIGWTAQRSISIKARLKSLEAQGLRRRSEA